MELSQPAVVTVTHYPDSLPLYTHTHTHRQARACTNTHTWPLVCAHTYSPVFRRAHTKEHMSQEHGQQGHPSTMLHKGHRYNRFTVTLMTAGIQQGWMCWPDACPFFSIFHLMTRKTDSDGTACYQRTPLKVSWLIAQLCRPPLVCTVVLRVRDVGEYMFCRVLMRVIIF